MFTNQTDYSEVVLLFGKNTISKQMPFSEFEAVLDTYATIPEFGGREARAAYLVVDTSLNITSCVLFLVEFCDDGSVNKSWNVPLRHMAEIAAPGPDLGSGPIRLVCHSQCPIAWQQNATWDPSMGGGADDFKMMVSIIKENKLCLSTQASSGGASESPSGQQPAWTEQPQQTAPQQAPYGAPPQAWGNQQAAPQWGGQPMAQQGMPAQMPQNGAWPPQAQQWQQPPPNWNGVPQANYPPQQAPQGQAYPHAQLQEDEASRAKTASLLRKLRLRLTTLENAKSKELAEIQFEHQKESQHFKIQKRRLQSFINSLTEQNEALKEQLNSQKNQIGTLEESVGAKLEQAVEHEKKEIMALKQNFHKRLEENEVEEIAHLKEICQVKEMELLYKEEITNQLREEVVVLRRDKIRLVDSGADNFLGKLESLGISFINFHPGIGHLSIPLEDMSKYMEDTEAYVAEKCLVPQKLYTRWRAHYDQPICQCETSPGEVCGARIQRQQVPSQYIEGETDRCAKHKRQGANDEGYKSSNNGG